MIPKSIIDDIESVSFQIWNFGANGLRSCFNENGKYVINL